MMILDVTTQTVDYWAIAGRVAVVVAMLSSAVGVFVWRTVLKAFFTAGMREARADLKDFCETDLWKERIARHDAAIATIGELHDRVEYLDAAVKQQGKALMESFTDAMTRQTESIQTIARNSTMALTELKDAFKDLREETSETRETVAEIRGFLRNAPEWTGTNRRSTDR